jgi:hypothetical protein
VADSLQEDPALPRFLFQGDRDQTLSENEYGEIPWQPGLFEGGANPSEWKPP